MRICFALDDVIRAKTVKIGLVYKKFVDPDIDQPPIIQACPFDSFIGNIKPQGLDQVQYAAGGGAGSGDIAGVHRDLRLYHYDVQHRDPPCKPGGKSFVFFQRYW
jgi:hypothetical protein